MTCAETVLTKIRATLLNLIKTYSISYRSLPHGLVRQGAHLSSFNSAPLRILSGLKEGWKTAEKKYAGNILKTDDFSEKHRFCIRTNKNKCYSKIKIKEEEKKQGGAVRISLKQTWSGSLLNSCNSWSTVAYYLNELAYTRKLTNITNIQFSNLIFFT